MCVLCRGLSGKFQTVEWTKLQFPATYLIDYVRIYQRKGQENVGCSPKDYPTEDYINAHRKAYDIADYTTWEAAGYARPLG